MTGRDGPVKITVEVCDVCHDRDREVAVWRIAPPGGQIRRVALCDEHAAPLRGLPALNAAAPQRRARKVVSRDQVRRKRG